MDYLLKPIHEKHLEEALLRIRSIHGARHNEILLRTLSDNVSREKHHSIAIPVVSGFENVLLDKLMYIKADGSHTHFVHDANRVLTVAKNLKYFESVLEGDSRFMRIHRSSIINLQHVMRFESTGKGMVAMKDGTMLDVARERKDAFRARFSVK